MGGVGYLNMLILGGVGYGAGSNLFSRATSKYVSIVVDAIYREKKCSSQI